MCLNHYLFPTGKPSFWAAFFIDIYALRAMGEKPSIMKYHSKFQQNNHDISKLN